MYETVDDIMNKAKAFTTLYELNVTKSGSMSERDEVFNVLDRFFVISNETRHRMKASDLYTRVSDLVTSTPIKEKSQFNRRLSSYFIEKGMTRKRYSDGIYYYGIQDRISIRKDESKIGYLKTSAIDFIKPFIDKNSRINKLFEKFASVEESTTEVENITLTPVNSRFIDNITDEYDNTRKLGLSGKTISDELKDLLKKRDEDIGTYLNNLTYIPIKTYNQTQPKTTADLRDPIPLEEDSIISDTNTYDDLETTPIKSYDVRQDVSVEIQNVGPWNTSSINIQEIVDLSMNDSVLGNTISYSEIENSMFSSLEPLDNYPLSI